MKLYEYLPTIYTLAGLLIGLAFDNMLGRVSAAVLIFAGMLVFNMRLEHRTNLRLNLRDRVAK